MHRAVSSRPFLKLLLVSALFLLCAIPVAQAQVCTPGEVRWVPTAACCQDGLGTWYSQETCWNGQFWWPGKVSGCFEDPCP